jgi:hypothetical protein
MSHKNCIAKIAVSFGGVTAGERNGERGYMLTFVIAYIRVRNIKLSVVFLKNIRIYLIIKIIDINKFLNVSLT